MLLLLSACGESVDPNESTKPAAPTAPVAPKAENTEQAAPEEIYAYNPAGKRDPFQTFLTIDSTDPKDGDAGTGPLCNVGMWSAMWCGALSLEQTHRVP